MKSKDQQLLEEAYGSLIKNKNSYGFFPQEDVDYTMDTLLSLWKERETITKEQVFEHLGELLRDLDLLD